MHVPSVHRSSSKKLEMLFPATVLVTVTKKSPDITLENIDFPKKMVFTREICKKAFSPP